MEYWYFVCILGLIINRQTCDEATLSLSSSLGDDRMWSHVLCCGLLSSQRVVLRKQQKENKCIITTERKSKTKGKAKEESKFKGGYALSSSLQTISNTDYYKSIHFGQL